MTDAERDQAIADLQTQVAELTRRLDGWDAATDRARAVMPAPAQPAADDTGHARANRKAESAARIAELERLIRKLRKP